MFLKETFIIQNRLINISNPDCVSNGYRIELRYSCIYVSYRNTVRNTVCILWINFLLIALKTSTLATGIKLAYFSDIMETIKKKILIFDESGFSRICSAILEKEGYGTNAICDVHKVDSIIKDNDFGLVITSYPFGAYLLEKLKQARIPTIILSDNISRELMMTLEHFDKSLSYCMIKPLDYNKFRSLVNQTMRGCGERPEQ